VDDGQPATFVSSLSLSSFSLVPIQIIGQAIYQIIVALVLHFAGHQIFGFHSTDEGTRIDQDNELSTLIFNSFVFCQICTSSYCACEISFADRS
jgi:magnesium-transporting ATPase (P-type)